MRTRFIVPVAAVLSLAGLAVGQTDQSRAYSAELLADANARISSAGEDAAMPKVGGALQFRYDINVRDNVPGGNDTTNGFQTRLTTVWATGTIQDKFSYRVQGNFDVESGDFVLEDAYFVHPMGEGWLVGAGQLYFPVLWEDYVDKWRQLGVDYSPTNSTFSPGRVQGLFVNYTGDSFRFWGALDDGAQTANTDFTSSAEADYALTGRAEFKFAGDWNQFNDMTSFRNSNFASKIGGVLHWQSGGDTFNTVDMDVLLATVDVCVEGNGWNVFGAVIYRGIEPAGGSTITDWGVVLQGGVFVSDDWELFGRYDVTIPDDDDRPGTQDPFNTFTIGVNHYFVPDSLAAKLSFDLCYFPDTQADSIVPASTITGLLADTEGDQWNIRAQMQLLF